MSQIYVLYTLQFYPKVLSSFTLAIIGLKWVQVGKTFYPPPNPAFSVGQFCVMLEKLRYVGRNPWLLCVTSFSIHSFIYVICRESSKSNCAIVV